MSTRRRKRASAGATSTRRSSALWDARLGGKIDDPIGHPKTLPPIVSSGDGGQPMFAFLSKEKFGSRKSKAIAIEFYTTYVNKHLRAEGSDAGTFRMQCALPPDLAFEYVRPAWNMKAAADHIFRKLKNGSGPKQLQAVYDRHKHESPRGGIETQFFRNMRKMNSVAPDGYQIDDMFDFVEQLQNHMKQEAKRMIREQHAIEDNAALRIQCRWRIKSGQFALHLKRQARDKKQFEEDRRTRAALRIQCAWRRRQGSLALHLKRQAKREAAEERERERKAAITIQLAWRRKKGQMVLHMKRRLKAEEEEMRRAAIKIQNAWRRRDAKMMVKNMKKKMLEEEEEMNQAAITIQLAWRRKKGQMVLHMKRRLKAEEEEMRRAAIKIQNAWRRRDAKMMVKNMKKKMLEEEEEMHRAALKIQCAWRRKKGSLALHMKRQAKKAMRDAEAWVVVFDPNQGGTYFYDYSTQNSLWEMPEKLIDTELHTPEWIVCEDQRYRATYYFRTTDGSCHPLDENQYLSQGSGYWQPPPLAKIALKTEHYPKQGRVTTDIDAARAGMSVSGYGENFDAYAHAQPMDRYTQKEQQFYEEHSWY